MKKILLMLLGGLLFTTPTFAQDEEDVTSYIQNAGFDEDLTFQADGTMKEAISTTTSIGRSVAYIAADSTVYARPTETSSQQRPDGRKMDAVNGFIGRVQGWTIETNQAFPKCEWVYFGTVPYDLGETAVPVADDGDTYLGVPARPAAFSGEDNVGFAYLRAGWGGRAVYKQEVSLPCAKYRLEYWAININPNGKNGKNLSKVTCRKDTWADETGFTDQEWTLHTIEFTPTSSFTMEFGFESSGGSGSNPYLCIDGIKLYKIGEADPQELLGATMADCEELAMEAVSLGYEGLAAYIGDYGFKLDEISGEDDATIIAAIEKADADMKYFREIIAKTADIDAALLRIDALLQSTDYPGHDDLDAAYERIYDYKTNDDIEGRDVIALLLGAVAEADAAIRAYIMTQPASVESPADFTMFVQHPWFIDSDAEPTYEDGVWTFPKRYDAEGNDLYKEGDAASPNLNSEGWYIAGAEGGDQRLNWQRERSCWNAWNTNFSNTLAVAQDIEGLPNGYYTVTADLCTQSGCMNGTQHVFAETIAQKRTSSSLTTEGWDYNEWETLSMTAEQKVLVVDNKITIGAEGTGSNSEAAGWFVATNFHLYYLGEAPAEALKEAFDERVAECKTYAEGMHLAADKAAFQAVIAVYETATDYIPALTALATALEEAQKSEAKYNDYIPADGTTDGKTIPTVANTLKSQGGTGYGAAEEIVEYAFTNTMAWLGGETATYTQCDSVIGYLKNYANTYVPVFQKADDVRAASSEAGKAALQGVMDEQKAALISELKDLETINAYIATLNNYIAMVQKRNIYDDPTATDYTTFIQNPNLEAETGWEFDKGNGNTNTTSGQWFDGSSTKYIDSYNADSLANFRAMQLVKDLPNGTYNVGVYTRTPAEGAYICYAVGSDTTFVEIPMNYHNTFTEAGEDTVVVASDQFGPLWEEARMAVEETGEYTELQLSIYNANNGNGRGWQHQEMNNIVVTNHELLIGTMSGTEASKTPKMFLGSWYSVGGWTLTLVAKGDNSGWDGPVISGIRNIEAVKVADGIYTISGVKTANLKRGLNIVISDGKAKKVLVK